MSRIKVCVLHAVPCPLIPFILPFWLLAVGPTYTLHGCVVSSGLSLLLCCGRVWFGASSLEDEPDEASQEVNLKPESRKPKPNVHSRGGNQTTRREVP